MDHFVPIASFNYYDQDGYSCRAVVVKNQVESTAEKLYDKLVQKRVQVGNDIIKVDNIEYENYNGIHDVIKIIKMNEPLILIVRNKQSLLSLRARLHPRMMALVKKYRHNSASSAKVMMYGVLMMGLVALVALFVIVGVLGFNIA